MSISRGSAYLATSATGLQLRGSYFRRAAAWTTTSPDHTIHDLRHYAARSWLRQGIPINQVAAWLGDDPRTVLKVYAHVLGEAQDIEALRCLNAPLPSHSPGSGSEHESREEGMPETFEKTASGQV
jgi:integrase